MSTRPGRVRPTLNSIRMNMRHHGPDAKRRRLENHGINTNGNGGIKRTGTGPRTRGMIETNDGDDGSNGTTEKIKMDRPSTSVDRSRVEDEDKEDSSSESSSSDESDSSGSEDSSDIDMDECNEKSGILAKDAVDLEKQFIYLRELLYKERIIFVEGKLSDIKAGTAYEFLSQVEQLQGNMRIRVEIASSLRDYRLINLNHKALAEEIGAEQDFNSDKALLRDSIKQSLDEKIHRLEQDRNNDFTSELWLDKVMKRKNKKAVDIFGEKKRKPTTVVGPFIVYMLHDVDIVEDWTIIKKAATAPNRMLKVF